MARSPLLAIETSCDETSAAVVTEGFRVLSHVVHSQVKAHEKWGGVVPEVASREHCERLPAVVEEALGRAGVEPRAVAVTIAPGLIGSLLVGVSFAKAFAFARALPILGVHHIAGHLAAIRIDRPDFAPPYLALVVSGGHTELVHVLDTERRVVARSTDDAAGEAFDKAARLLELGFPGGPAIEAAAARATGELPKLAGTLMAGSRDFSFSGLKTALLYHLKRHPISTDDERCRLAAAFQKAVVDSLCRKTRQALTDLPASRLLLTGGVAANTALRLALAEVAAEHGADFAAPAKEYCTDNAAMIAAAALAGWAEPLALDAGASPEMPL